MDSLTCYVAPDGNDAWSGTRPEPTSDGRDGPFATPQRARDAARAARETVATELFWRDDQAKGRHTELLSKRQVLPERPAVTIYLRGGTYYLAQTLKLQADDSGTRTHPVRWQAYEDEEPVLSGSVAVQGWEPWKDGIWRAPLPDCCNRRFTSRELFYQGKRLIRSRYPKFEPANPRRGGFLFPSSGDEQAPYRAFHLPDGFNRIYAHPDEGEINITCGHGWCNAILPIDAIDDGRVTVARKPIQLAWAPLAMMTPFTSVNRFYIQNMLEDLEQPGEWCLVHHERMLYLKPPAGEPFNPEAVELPVLGQLIDLEGAQHVSFHGITFTQCRQLGDNYHREGNSGYGAMLPQPDWIYCGEAVRVAWSQYVDFEDCTVDQIGGNGIYFERKSWWCHVRRCTLSHVGCNPLVFIGDRFDHPYACTVEDCEIHDGGDLLNYVAGVFCGVSDAIRIEHNHIHDMPHHAINLATNGRGRNFIEYNRIEHVTLEIADTGAINSWMDDPCKPGEPSSPFVERCGHVIRHNYIAHVRGCISHPDGQITDDQTTRGIYLDDGTSNCIVQDNIVIDAPSGMQIHGGKHNLVENNLFIDTLVAVLLCNDPCNRRGSGFTREMLRGNHFVNNIMYSRRTSFPHWWAPQEEQKRASLFWFTQATVAAPDEVFARCDGNVYYAPHAEGLRIDQEAYRGDDWSIKRIDFSEWQEVWGLDRHSLSVDPCFVDPDKGEYGLQPDSPAFALGIRSIDTSTIGIRA